MWFVWLLIVLFVFTLSVGLATADGQPQGDHPAICCVCLPCDCWPIAGSGGLVDNPA